MYLQKYTILYSTFRVLKFGHWFLGLVHPWRHSTIHVWGSMFWGLVWGFILPVHPRLGFYIHSRVQFGILCFKCTLTRTLHCRGTRRSLAVTLVSLWLKESLIFPFSRGIHRFPMETYLHLPSGPYGWLKLWVRLGTLKVSREPKFGIFGDAVIAEISMMSSEWRILHFEYSGHKSSSLNFLNPTPCTKSLSLVLRRYQKMSKISVGKETFPWFWIEHIITP